MIRFKNLKSFEWDTGNIDKNYKKHGVHWTECEEVFFNEPLIVKQDLKHSDKEERFYVLGKTNNNRLLFIVFTIRKEKIRVISARDMNKRERKVYHEIEKNT
ncbi:MAG: BrnT family toxin [Nitrospirae bacterium]|nr:BrnT family toxin [Nitrospirota bacterium]